MMPELGDWIQLAAMLTVMTLCGSIFTWVVSALIDKKMAKLKDEILKENTAVRAEFVSKETLGYLLKQADESHARYDRTFVEVWTAIEDIRKARHHDAI